MKVFIWTMVVVFVIEITGKASMLNTRNFTTKPSYLLIDIAIATGLIIWAALLLGAGA